MRGENWSQCRGQEYQQVLDLEGDLESYSAYFSQREVGINRGIKFRGGCKFRRETESEILRVLDFGKNW